MSLMREIPNHDSDWGEKFGVILLHSLWDTVKTSSCLSYFLKGVPRLPLGDFWYHMIFTKFSRLGSM